MKHEMAELRKTRIANAVEHAHDAIDTPFEVDVFTAGKMGPIDTPVEIDRYLKGLNP